MKIYNYWLSPNKTAKIKFCTDEICCSENENNVDYDIAIRQVTKKEIPMGLILNKWSLQKAKDNNFEIVSSFKIINDETKEINEKLLTKIKGKKVEILTPFDDLYLLGNDLCFLSLIADEAITIRCSSVLMNETLYLFAGRSGSGKSTILHKIKECFGNRVTVVSDDHLSMKMNDNNLIEAVTPFWDEINIDIGGQKVRTKKMVLFFLEDSSDTIEQVKNSFLGITLLVKHCVLFAFADFITAKIMCVVEKLVSNYDMFTCPIKNSHEILGFLKMVENGKKETIRL